MAKTLLEKIRERFHKGVKKAAADSMGVKQSCYQHFSQGRPLRDFMIVLLRKLYGRKYNPNGFTDEQLLDFLEKDYDKDILNDYMDNYK